MQAIILAAGLGNRIREYHVLPKGFLKVGGDYIINASLTALFQHAISEVLIVTGYGAWHYNQLVAQYSSVTTHYNERFESCGSLYSLYTAKDWVRGDVLVLESDIIYESRAIDAILHTRAADAIVVSGFTQSGDEVFVAAEGTSLMSMSKNRSSLQPAFVVGEFVGINKLSFTGYHTLMKRLEKNHDLLHHGHYDEDGLVDLASQCPIHCVILPNLLWSEIDNQAHFARAQHLYTMMQR